MPSLTPITAWNKCLSHIQNRVDPRAFDAWFAPLQPLQLREDVLTLQVPSVFHYEWIEDHFLDILKDSLNQVLPKGLRLEYVVADSGRKHRASPREVGEKLPSASSSTLDQDEFANKCFYQAPLSPDYTFARFVEGKANQVARRAALAITQKVGHSSFNPLVLYGGVGLGKTHLMQAIAHQIKTQEPKHKVSYLSAEQFVQQFMYALNARRMDNFYTHYYSLDALLVDDIHFLKGKSATQEILFHIFNELHQKKKQLVFSCDTPPDALSGMHERLISRFLWGLTAHLQMPDYAMRYRLIAQKIEEENISLSASVHEFLAKHLQTNIREIEGALISLTAQATYGRIAMDLALAQRVVDQFVKPTQTPLSLNKIQSVVARHFNIKPALLLEKTRRREIVMARKIAMWLAKHHTRHSCKDIGACFGGRDHSTVIYALQSMTQLMKHDTRLQNQVNEMEAILHCKTALSPT